MENIDKHQEYLRSIGASICKTRLQRGMKQKDLAIRSNMEKASISRIESGKTNMTMLTLLQLADSLEISVGDLLNATKEMTVQPGLYHSSKNTATPAEL